MPWWIVEHALTTAACVMAVALLCRLPRMTPAMRHALWVVALLKLFLPPLVYWPWSAAELWPTNAPAAVVHEPSLEAPKRAIGIDDEVPMASNFYHAELQNQTVVILNASPEVGAEAAKMPNQNAVFTIGIWLIPFAGGIWFFGSVVVLAVQVYRLGRIQRWVAQGLPAHDELRQSLQKLTKILNRKPPPIALLPGLRSPILWGFGRTRILWPLKTAGLSNEAQQTMLMHELAHWLRRDHWVAWLQLAARCVWWWHPLCWLICRQIKSEAEASCDAWVVGLFPEKRRIYAEALLHAVSPKSAPAQPILAVGMGGNRRQFERRLKMIMRSQKTYRLTWRGLALVGSLVLILGPAWSLAQQSTPRAHSPVSATKTAASPETDPFAQTQSKPAAPRGTINDTTKSPAARATGRKSTTLDPYGNIRQPSVRSAQGTAQKNAFREKRLRELEKQLADLQQEIRRLRGNSAYVQQGQFRLGYIRSFPNTAKPSYAQTTNSKNVQVLHRIVYKLPKDKADALALFLKEQVKGKVVETKVEKDGLVVTTSPEIQQAVQQIIRLIHPESRANLFQRSKSSLDPMNPNANTAR